MNKNTAALEFLLSRRSRPAKTLTTPVPSIDELTPILTAAARSPDHGKLEPWRFIVLQAAALARLAIVAERRATEMGLETEAIEKTKNQFSSAHLVIAVVASPVPSAKVPEIEQVLSAGAVCLSLLNGALASGWGANWLSGPMSMDRAFLTDALSLTSTEFVAGYIHIGTERIAPPERPRPDLSTKVSWVDT